MVIACANVEHDRNVVQGKNVHCACVLRFNDVTDVAGHISASRSVG